MTLTSLDFFLFLIVGLVLFYLSGKRLQKYTLLLLSLYFFLQVVSIETGKVLLILGYILVVTWLGALLIDKCKEKRRTVVTCLSVSALVAVLFVFKYAYNMVLTLVSLFRINADVTFLHFASLMGISYFVLSAIGYLMDVCWGSYPAEKNISKIALFLFYFPQLVSGPITRYPMMREQFEIRHKPEADNLAYGLRRMAWGYFKKLLISERFAIIVSAIYGNPDAYNGFWLVVGTLCYVIRLYTDFSGCMDIILGASRLFGITLPENFNAPFLSRSFKEFWQRWHITLGSWFKDYVMYPLQISGPFVKLGKKCKKRFGKNVGKKVPTYLSMLFLWFLLGIWHGATAHYFVATGLVPFLLLVGSDLLQPLFDKMLATLKINADSFGYKLFQRIRTIFVVCIGWVFICAETIPNSLTVWKQILTRPFGVCSADITAALYTLTAPDMIIMILGLLVLLWEHYCVSRQSNITVWLDNRKAPVKIAVIYAEVLLILFFGMVGSSTFIYFNF